MSSVDSQAPRASLRIKLGPGAGRHPDRAEPIALGAPTAVPPVETLGELLEHWAAVRAASACAYFIDLDDNVTRLCWGELRDRAQRVAVGLHAAGVRSDDRVMLALPTSPELLESFFGCQLLGALPCIVEPPAAGRGFAVWCERMAPKLGLVEPSLMVTGPGLCEAVAAGLGQAGAALAVVGFDTLPADGEIPKGTRAGASAVLQFTSGTTSSPKAVTCSHRAVLANVACVGSDVRQFREGDLMVGWLPLFHDMGLVATTLAALAHGLPVALMPPAAFVLRPARWLWAMHMLRGSVAFAPNFAYRLCLRRLPAATPDLNGLDLSAWRIAFNAAEFIHAETARSFTARFSAYGFPALAMTPAYGMAEMAVGVSSHEVASPLRTETISRTVLGREGRACPTNPASADALELVSVGRVFLGHALEIHEGGRSLGERREGQIVIRGPSLFDGYYRNESATSDALRDGWLQTGDLGYLAEDRLFITGRSKDLIIRGGENHHPHLLEAAAQDAPGVRGGRVAAVGLANAEVGTEDIALIVETTEREPTAMEQIRFEVESRVHRATGLRPDRVVLVPPNTIPMTTSGKVRRALARHELLRRLA